MPPPTLSSSPPPHQGAVVTSNRIAVTHVVKQTSERIQSDINELIRIPVTDEPWDSCFVRTDQVESENSNWGQLLSASVPLQGIFIVGKCSEGRFCEIAVCSSYFPWLVGHCFPFESGLRCNRVAPTDAERQLYDKFEVRKRAQARFLQRLALGISSKPGRKFEQYCRRITPVGLQISLERAILSHHLQISSPQVRRKVCQWLMVNGLSLIKVSNCQLAFELLGKDEDQLLEGFRHDHTNLLEVVSSYQRDAEYHKLSVCWSVLASCGVKNDFRPRKFDPKYTYKENADIIGALVGISGPNHFGDFDSQAMLNDLSYSKIFTQDEISMLDIAKLTSEMATSLQIGFPKGHLDLPTEMLYGLSTGAVNEARTYWSQIYRQQPSLNKPDNNVLLVLIWSSNAGDISLKFRKWADSDDALHLRRRLLKDAQKSQSIEQFTLTLAALRCLYRLAPYSPGTTQSTKGCFLEDFDALLTGKRLINECIVLEHMILSLCKALDTLGGDYQDIRGLLNAVLDTGTIALKHLGGISVQYCIRRTKNRLDHRAARAWTHGSCMLQSSKSFLAGVSALVLPPGHDLISQIQYLLSPTRCYKVLVTISTVVLFISFLPYLELLLACKILLFSTCGEFFVLFKLVNIRHKSQRPDQWFLHFFAPLYFLKFTLTCVLFFLDWTELTGELLALATLIVCGLQSALLQFYRKVESGVLDLNLGRQYWRRESLAAFYSEIDYTSYALVRLSNLENHDQNVIFAKLDKVGRLHEVPSISKLPDGSLEMIALKSYLPELEIKLGKIFPGCRFHPNYDPTEPSREDVDRLHVVTKISKSSAKPGDIVPDEKPCYTVAKTLKINAFSSRAMGMIGEKCWPIAPIAAGYYNYLLKRNNTWLKENAQQIRMEKECYCVVRKRSWRRLLSLIIGKQQIACICLESVP